MADIAASLDIRSTMDVALINEIDPTMIIQRDGWIITKDVVVMHIRDQGSWAHEPNVKAALNKHNEKTFFNEAWDCLKGCFMQLRQLCGGLAIVFPNTTSVESDFSIVKWEKNDSHNSLTSLSLACIMHAKQFEQIKMIKRQSFA